jgi:hypothetical protein
VCFCCFCCRCLLQSHFPSCIELFSCVFSLL